MQPPQGQPPNEYALPVRICCGIVLAGTVLMLLLAGLVMQKGAPAGDSPPVVTQIDKAERRRHDIWNDYCSKEAEVQAKVEKRYPNADLLSGSKSAGLARVGRRNQYESDLQDAYKPRLFKRWHITHKDLADIEIEGITKRWPGPEPIGPDPERFPE